MRGATDAEVYSSSRVGMIHLSAANSGPCLCSLRMASSGRISDQQCDRGNPPADGLSIHLGQDRVERKTWLSLL